MLQLLLLLLPVAAASGWLAGYKHRQNLPPEQTNNFVIPPDYFIGLNYLINEQPDKAVDVFIKMLEVNSDTVETHLALGNLFRKRGEVDRAIRIHQNLIARPQLGKQQRVAALSELAQDYLRAGVLDRAERLFLELINLDGETTTSLHYLLNIYQQQKDWRQAINIAKKLAVQSQEYIPIAYFYCELAENARLHGYIDEAQANIKQAFDKDKNCVRASLIKGKMLFDLGDAKSAIRAYKEVKQQDPDFISEIVLPLKECYEKINQEAEFINYLQECLIAYPRISIVLALSDYVKKLHGDKTAIDFIAKQIHHNLSLHGINRLVELYLGNVDFDAREKLYLLREFIGKLLENKPIYRCVCCGFAGKQLHWQCPSCKRWAAIKPIHGLEGD
jgi:lipopolysaccharide assembly protein B